MTNASFITGGDVIEKGGVTHIFAIDNIHHNVITLKSYNTFHA